MTVDPAPRLAEIPPGGWYGDPVDGVGPPYRRARVRRSLDAGPVDTLVGVPVCLRTGRCVICHAHGLFPYDAREPRAARCRSCA